MIRTVVISLAVMLASVSVSLGYDLRPIGAIPELSANWEICVDDREAEINEKSPYRWIVFRNKTSGDLLSFATAPPEIGKERTLEYWSDTALEMFPNGHPAITRKVVIAEQLNHVISIKPIKLHNLKRDEVLAYCYVAEATGRENLMAHGAVWVGKNRIVFIQHTSTKPITSVFVENTLVELIGMQSVESGPKTP